MFVAYLLTSIWMRIGNSNGFFTPPRRPRPLSPAPPPPRRLRQEIGRHARTHRAQPKQCNFAHRLSFTRRPHSRRHRFLLLHCHVMLCGVVRSLSILDPYGLRVYKGVRTEVRKLATVAAVFHTAYRNARVRSGNTIDENTTGVEIARNLARQVDVSGPEIAAQTELAGIRRADGRVNIWNTGDRCDGTERLLIEGGHAFGYSAQHG